ncbi:HCL039Wp [Eremothecium sinecaudum]|uniref:Condensin complex subunit 1 n=1 Tax=Eremothecium sinecaudum TaxID=45286 RepID=A0A0X8HRI6_9SACH|nr:HCL039Wp [Eremothecium sinecaudum]AMD20112.1 HCL039Wp [Eremothecium sinecaudum]
MSFNLTEYLARFRAIDKRSFPPVDNATRELNRITDRLAVSPEDIDSDQDLFETLIDLAQGFSHLLPKLQQQLSYLVSSCLRNLTQVIADNINDNSDREDILSYIPSWKLHLEEFCYLLHVILTFLQDEIASSSVSSAGKSNYRKNESTFTAEQFKRSCIQVEGFLEVIVNVLELPLFKIFQTTRTRDVFVGLFIKPLYVLIETEPVIKIQSLKFFIMRIIASSVKNHGQLSNVLNLILSSLTYFPHLANFNADLLKVLNDDFGHPQLTEEILRDISNKEFNTRDTTGPKVTSNFLIRLSEILPKVVLRQMTSIVKLLNNSSFTLRCAVVEACGNIAVDIIKDNEAIGNYKNQLEVLLELLEERFRDSNPYVRSKAIQGCLKICELEIKFNRNRLNLVKLAVRSLQDRSSLVRRNAVKLLSKLILTHPFTQLHGTQLRLTEWEERHRAAMAHLKKSLSNNERSSNRRSLHNKYDGSSERDSSEDDSNSEENSEHRADDGVEDYEVGPGNIEQLNERENITKGQDLLKMELTVRYYTEAVDFITAIHEGIKLACGLLLSKNRNEVLETMDFFVLADAYDVELSYLGIKRMLNLVWMEGSNNEGITIASHLVECYKNLFLTAPETYNYKEKAIYIAKNLVNLTKNTSVADLASLEKLLGMMYQAKFIDQNIVNVLWAIYNSAGNNQQETFTTEQIHGSIIIIGFLSLVDHEVALKGIDALLNSGLGEPGKKDSILSKFTCIALQRIVPADSKKSIDFEIPRADDAVNKLQKKILEYTDDPKYFPVCEQAINALFAISSQPDVVCTAVIKEKIMMTFGEPEDSAESESHSRITSLTQLLFIVGQVAIKTIEYLEKCEAEFKKRKQERKVSNNDEKNQPEDGENNEMDVSINQDDENNKELEMIGGTVEDDFADAVQHIRENELIFGEFSLIGKFGPLVEEIVSNSGKFSDPALQRSAVLCLEKLMCVSSKYCERNLPLLITIMEKSEDPIIRSNAVLGLGDMAVCFNNLVDENTDYLYHRLHDDSIMVQRTCLMTVTFLILAGQVKVKGQLAQMAKCLEDDDQGISDMCKLFFTELATKDNAIYNGFIDIFSGLSNDDELKKESFKHIMKFLLSFIDKERQQKQLSEKLLGRLSKVESQKQWDDIAAVLNMLPYKNEKINLALEEGFKLVSARD